MYETFSPEKRPAKLLAPSLMVAVLCSISIGLLKVGYGRVPETFDTSTTLLLMSAVILGAFGAFSSALLNSALVWLYGRIVKPDTGFVRTFAVVAFALGIVLASNLILSTGELLLTGAMPTLPATNLSRYLGAGYEGLDLLLILNASVLYMGSKQYLGYSVRAAVILASLFVIISMSTGILL